MVRTLQESADKILCFASARDWQLHDFLQGYPPDFTKSPVFFEHYHKAMTKAEALPYWQVLPPGVTLPTIAAVEPAAKPQPVESVA